MTHLPRALLAGLLGSALALLPVRAPGLDPSLAGAEVTLFGLVRAQNALLRFESATPGQATRIDLTGVPPGETVRAIDFRPATGELYGLSVAAGGSPLRLVRIDPLTGATASVHPTTVAGLLAGNGWGMAFNPVVDRIRIVNEQGENARLNPDLGTLAGDDSNLTPAPAGVVALAYSNPYSGATTGTATAFVLSQNSLARLGGEGGAPSPNFGIVTVIGPLGLSASLDAGRGLAFAPDGTLFAALRPLAVSGATGLYRVDAATGAATLIGSIGSGGDGIDGLAIRSPLLTLSPPSGTYLETQRLDVAILVELANLEGVTVTALQATLDGADVTQALERCAVPGTLAAGAGGSTFRCRSLVQGGAGGRGAGRLPVGLHTLVVTATLSNGGLLRQTASWTVVGGTEP